MNGWHPRASRVPATRDGGAYLTGFPWRQVIHTTEIAGYSASPNSYYGHESWPHCTIHAGRIYQHIPITRAARALKNLPGGVETNRARAVQVEVAWKAGEIAWLPDDQKAALADWLLWVHEQTGCPLTWPRFVGADERPAGVNARQRMTAAAWTAFAGVCGHQHVVENDHWDPGVLDLRSLLGNHDDATPPDALEEEDDMERTYRWPNGDVATVDLDGGVRCYGARFTGSVPMLPPQHRQGFMEAGGAGALRPVDPADSQAGYIVHRRDGNPFKFDRDQARALGL